MLQKTKTIVAVALSASLLAGCQTGRSHDATANYMDRQERALRAGLKSSGVGFARDGDNLVLDMGNDILFERNSAQLKPEARLMIRQVGLVLKRFPATIVNVDGFTDTTGARDYNLNLSTLRADAVAGALRASGVEEARLSARGYGENYLKVRTRDGADEKRNRRVEITLVPYLG